MCHAAAFAILGLDACGPVSPERATDMCEERARAAQGVIDNASSRELLSLAADAVTGPTASTVEITTNILSRPATLQCLATEGLSVLQNGLQSSGASHGTTDPSQELDHSRGQDLAQARRRQEYAQGSDLSLDAG